MSAKKYVIYCNDESLYIEGWSSSIPTNCFHDDAHTINGSKTKELIAPGPINTRLAQTYDVLEASTTDRYFMHTITGDINPNETKDILFNFDVDTNLYAVKIHCHTHNIGDRYDTHLNKDTLIGIVTEVGTNIKTVKVSPTVVSNSVKGYFLKFGSNSYSRITGIGSDTVTVVDNVTVNMNDMVYICYYLVKDREFITSGDEELGSSIIGSSKISAGTIGGITYYNTEAHPKKVYIDLETTFSIV